MSNIRDYFESQKNKLEGGKSVNITDICVDNNSSVGSIEFFSTSSKVLGRLRDFLSKLVGKDGIVFFGDDAYRSNNGTTMQCKFNYKGYQDEEEEDEDDGSVVSSIVSLFSSRKRRRKRKKSKWKARFAQLFVVIVLGLIVYLYFTYLY